MINLKGNPFCLNDSQCAWVENTLSGMTDEEKICHLFCVGFSSFSKKEVQKIATEKKPGALMIRPMKAAEALKGIRWLQEYSRIPVLVASNLEYGGAGAVLEGTKYSMPMGCGATGDPETGYRLGKISCHEGAAVGVNWAFAPVVDIDNNYQNPITNIRSFSNDADVVKTMAAGYLKAAKEENVAVSIKHFPGDGCDERDQHLLVSVNDKSYEEWMDTYGSIYRDLIARGAQTVMVGHIAQPAMVRHYNPDVSKKEALLPASQSKYLIDGVLRKELGFNGLVVTDASLMVGYMQTMPRKLALPTSIMAGIDMILFNRNMDEDISYFKEALNTGLLTRERLDEAVTRILAMKAALKLPEKRENNTLVPDEAGLSVLGCDEYKKWARECADKAVTLVKDTENLLPLSPKKTRRIYLNVVETYVSKKSPFAMDIKARLEKEGFEVTLRNRKIELNPELMMKGIITPAVFKVLKEIQMTTESFVSQYDMSMIVVNMETASNTPTVRIGWKVVGGLGNDAPWYAGEIPCVVISTANPYHLLDIPMADVYVNAYTETPEVLDAVFDKLMGRSEFKGASPVDAFCGHEDTMI